MPHPFEVRKEIDVDASPEAVWEAVATGAGIDGWFLGTGNEVEPREGGRVYIDFGGAGGSEAVITTWAPPHRLAYGGEPGPDGTMHAFEYEIEGIGGRTHVRFVHSGFLVDDWEAEYESLREGDAMYLHQMAQYVVHFLGRRATTLSIWHPAPPAERDATLLALRRGLGLPATVANGDSVRLTPEGLPPVEGVVDFVTPSILGIRTDDALLRFLHTPQGVAYLGHHLYGEVDGDAAKEAWTAWLERTLAAPGAEAIS